MAYRSVAIKKHIASVNDVREFFDDLKREDLMIHPHSSFTESERPEWNLSPAMIDRLDGTLNDCHEVCVKHGVDILNLACDLIIEL